MSKDVGGSIALQVFTLPARHERLATFNHKSRRKRSGNNNREDVMLTRRDFAGFASCAICAVTGFVATEASAQGAPAATTPGVTRKLLSKTDGPTAGYETLLMEAEIEAGVPVGRHTHPGVESAYVLEGGFELPIEGQQTRMLKPGDGFQIPPNTPHAGGKPGTAKSKILITYVVEKGKPLATPV